MTSRPSRLEPSKRRCTGSRAPSVGSWRCGSSRDERTGTSPVSSAATRPPARCGSRGRSSVCATTWRSLRDDSVTPRLPSLPCAAAERLNGSISQQRRPRMRAHRRVVAFGAVALALGATLAAGVAAIATGRSGRDAAVFARTAKLNASRGPVARGLSLDGTALVAHRAGGKQMLGSLGGGGEHRRHVRRLLVVAPARADQARRARPGARHRPARRHSERPPLRPAEREGRSARQRGGVAGRLDERFDRVRRRREPDGPPEHPLPRPDRGRRLTQLEAASLDERAGALPPVRMGPKRTARSSRCSGLRGRRPVRLFRSRRSTSARARRVRDRRLARRDEGARRRRHPFVRPTEPCTEVGALGREPEPLERRRSQMKALSVLVVIAAALAWTLPAPASVFYYDRTSLIYSYFEAVDNYGDWTGVRGGSGIGTDACQHYNWIPRGYYSVYWHDDWYAGTVIQGRVWRLSDYQCSNGVRRTELFVHSEENSQQGQSCYADGSDSPFCWEGDHDYYSYGCIKVARRPTPSDLRQIDSFVHTYGAATDLWVYS